MSRGCSTRSSRRSTPRIRSSLPRAVGAQAPASPAPADPVRARGAGRARPGPRRPDHDDHPTQRRRLRPGGRRVRLRRHPLRSRDRAAARPGTDSNVRQPRSTGLRTRMEDRLRRRFDQTDCAPPRQGQRRRAPRRPEPPDPPQRRRPEPACSRVRELRRAPQPLADLAQIALPSGTVAPACPGPSDRVPRAVPRPPQGGAAPLPPDRRRGQPARHLARRAGRCPCVAEVDRDVGRVRATAVPGCRPAGGRQAPAAAQRSAPRRASGRRPPRPVPRPATSRAARDARARPRADPPPAPGRAVLVRSAGPVGASPRRSCSAGRRGSPMPASAWCGA